MLILAVVQLAGAVDLVDCSGYDSCTACYNASYWCRWCNTSQPVESKQCLSRVSLTPCVESISCSDDAACSLRKNCTECAKSSVCHWCADLECHAVGSMYGCVVGVDCYDNKHCVRKDPEFIAYGSSPAWVWFVTVLCCMILCVCGVCIQGLCYRIKGVGDRNVAAEQYEARIETLQRQVRELNATRLTEDTTDANLAEIADDEASPEETHSEASASLDNVEANTPLLQDRLLSEVLDAIISRLFKYCCILWLVLIPTGCFLFFAAALHTPHMPVVNYCNRQTEWAKLINNIISVSTQDQVGVDFELLLSVYNPNRLDVDITLVSGQFVDPDTNVNIGHLSMAPLTATSGSVADVLATISFSVNRWAAVGMAKKWYENDLVFGANIDLAFTVRGYGVSLFSYDFGEQHSLINVSAPKNQEYCYCKVV